MDFIGYRIDIHHTLYNGKAKPITNEFHETQKQYTIGRVIELFTTVLGVDSARLKSSIEIIDSQFLNTGAFEQEHGSPARLLDRSLELHMTKRQTHVLMQEKLEDYLASLLTNQELMRGTHAISISGRGAPFSTLFLANSIKGFVRGSSCCWPE